MSSMGLSVRKVFCYPYLLSLPDDENIDNDERGKEMYSSGSKKSSYQKEPPNKSPKSQGGLEMVSERYW